MAKSEKSEAKSEVKAGPAAGDMVHLVLARGEHVPARVERVRGGDRIDLVAEIGGERVSITSSPLDETGKKPDSWHLPEANAAGEAKAE